MGLYSGFSNGVTENCACGANHALRRWPDPNVPAQSTLVADAVSDRRNGNVGLDLGADFYPAILNLLYCAVQPRGSIPAGNKADVLEPHVQTVSIYSGDATPPAATAAVVNGIFGPELDVRRVPYS